MEYNTPLNFNKIWQMNYENTPNIGLISCNSSYNLTHSIAKISQIPITKTKISRFNNGEINVELCDNVRNKHMFIISSMTTSLINDDCMELFLVIDACKRSDVEKITIILPYFPYSRSDKKDKPHVPIAASVITTILTSLDVHNIISLDLHASQLQGLISKGFHNLYIKNELSHYLLSSSILSTTDKQYNNDNYVFVAPDIGSIKRIEAYAKSFEMNYIILHKQRDYTKPGTIINSMIISNETEMYKNKTAIIIDDIGDTMRTMISAVDELIKIGIKNVIIGVTHGIFSVTDDGITAIDKIMDCKAITQVITTNSINQPEYILKCSKIKVIDISPLLACTIDGIITGKSVSSLIN